MHKQSTSFFTRLALASACLMAGAHVASGQATAPVSSHKFEFGGSHPESYKFVFGTAQVAPGDLAVVSSTTISNENGYGFETGAEVKDVHRGTDPATGSLITSDKPFMFSIAVPEGNYQLAVTLGDPAGESATTVKAEIRRLMVENAHLSSGQLKTYTFNVNVRTADIPGGGKVRLKDREKQGEARAWDERLTLEFDDAHPCVDSIQIKKLDNVPVVFVCGDSTVCDQPGEAYASWGQMLPRFFKPDVVIANHAESGESLGSFLGEKRWDKVMSQLKPGDTVIMQMGHNDEKDRGANAGAYGSYTTNLHRIVKETRAKGATPIIVDPMERRNFDGAKIKPSHGDYPDAVRKVAKEDNVAFIDLTAISVQFYETLGADKAYLAFAGTGLKRDATHHDNYGAYELAKVILTGIRDNKLDLAKSIVDDFAPFDPTKPDDVDSFTMPTGPSKVTLVPLGS